MTHLFILNVLAVQQCYVSRPPQMLSIILRQQQPHWPVRAARDPQQVEPKRARARKMARFANFSGVNRLDRTGQP